MPRQCTENTLLFTQAVRRRGRRVLRCSLVSLISITVSQSVLMVAFGMLHWTARLANVAACGVATVPSYYLNRSWAWGRGAGPICGGRSSHSGDSPFWAWPSRPGQPARGALARHAAVSHAATTAIVMTSSLLALGVLWVGKFAIFNVLLFAEPPHPRHLHDPVG